MLIRIFALSALGAFVVSGPLQHVGVLPQTAMGDASKSAIKMVMKAGIKEAHACIGGGNPGGGNGGGPQGNNGFGNGGGDGVPGNSGFQDVTR